MSSIDHAGDWALGRLIVDVARIVAHGSTVAGLMAGDIMDSTITGLGAQRAECVAGR